MTRATSQDILDLQDHVELTLDVIKAKANEKAHLEKLHRPTRIITVTPQEFPVPNSSSPSSKPKVTITYIPPNSPESNHESSSITPTPASPSPPSPNSPAPSPPSPEIIDITSPKTLLDKILADQKTPPLPPSVDPKAKIETLPELKAKVFFDADLLPEPFHVEDHIPQKTGETGTYVGMLDDCAFHTFGPCADCPQINNNVCHECSKKGGVRMDAIILMFDGKPKKISVWTTQISPLLQISPTDLVKYALKDTETLRARFLSCYRMHLFAITATLGKLGLSSRKFACKNFSSLVLAKKKREKNTGQ